MSAKTPPPYDARTAWRRATIYFTVCWFVATGTGSLQAVWGRPLATNAQLSDPLWWIWTAVCTAVILVGYGYIWPKGTLTHGRKLNIPAVLIFGFFWGTSEGLLFITVWSIIDFIVAGTGYWSPLLVGVATFLVLSTFKGIWHSQYWDIYVSPEHNIEEWNLRKVLLAHTPNLIVTLIHLNVFLSVGLFVIWQTIALMLSAYFMHFPFPSQPNSDTEQTP